MTQQHFDSATKFLSVVFKDSINDIAHIINAKADYFDGRKKSAEKTILRYLDVVEDYLNKLRQ